MTPVWTILVATIGQRGDRFTGLMNSLLPQVAQAEGRVTVLALWNNGERPLARVRQDLVEGAESVYTSFVDDDDEVPTYYVSKILPLLDGEIDYVGWRMQCIMNGVPLKPTFHSLRFGGWWETGQAYFRDVSHLNPVKRELALKYADFTRSLPPEDVSWADQMRGHLEKEAYLEDVMYVYRSSTQDSTWRGVSPGGPYVRPEIDSPYFSWHPASST